MSLMYNFLLNLGFQKVFILNFEALFILPKWTPPPPLEKDTNKMNLVTWYDFSFKLTSKTYENHRNKHERARFW